MIRVIALSVILATPYLLDAQFIQFSVQIEPEVDIRAQFELDFGNLDVTDSVGIELDDPRVGIFTISGMVHSLVEVVIDTPKYLINDEYPNCMEDWCRINVDLRYAWSNQGIQQAGRNAARLVPINQFQAVVDIPFKPADVAQQELSVLQIVLFVFGRAQTKEALPGIYAGQVQLSVLYD